MRVDRQSWNARYGASTVWSGRPNPAVVEHLTPIPARGLALDVGCGEGADAVWLASRGWDVVGVDWAGIALERARQRAASRALRARFVEGDATDPAFLASLSPTGTFDLVTVAYLHPEPEHRLRSYAHLPGLVSPGGHLLVLAHDPGHGDLGLGGPPAHRLLGPDDIVAALALPVTFRVLTRGVWRRHSGPDLGGTEHGGTGPRGTGPGGTEHAHGAPPHGAPPHGAPPHGALEAVDAVVLVQNAASA